MQAVTCHVISHVDTILGGILFCICIDLACLYNALFVRSTGLLFSKVAKYEEHVDYAKYVEWSQLVVR